MIGIPRAVAHALSVALLAGAALAPATAATAATAPPDVEHGRTLFQQKCVACHTVGGGEGVGPDLAGVTARRDGPWLTRWIGAPDRLLADGDPIAKELLAKYNNVPMPNMALTDAEVDALVAYLAAGSASPVPVARPGTPPPPAGDATIGRELFTGSRRFARDGPACMACHSIAGLGALGGGALGPDLTMAASKFGDAGLASVLSGMPFPTMSPIFTRRPLTPEEQSHLRVFIGQAAVAGRTPGAIGRLTVLAVLGAALGLGLAHVSWRRRLDGGVRRGLLRRAHAHRGIGGARS
jgi:mono/diheme cytochrome c family protein